MNTNTCMFFWCLSPSECASWVQAWGSIGAILIAIAVAKLQASTVAKAARLQDAARCMEAALTLDHLAQGAANAVQYVSAHLATRDHIDTAHRDGIPSQMRMLEQLAVRLNDYPTYVIPVETLRGANLLSGTVDQFVWKVHTVLDGYRSMNEAAFADFFSTVDDIKRSLAKTAAEIHGQAERATREFERLGGVGRRGG